MLLLVIIQGMLGLKERTMALLLIPGSWVRILYSATVIHFCELFNTTNCAIVCC